MVDLVQRDSINLLTFVYIHVLANHYVLLLSHLLIVDYQGPQ